MSDVAAAVPEETRFFVILMPWGRVGSNLVVGALDRMTSVKVANEPTTAIVSAAQRDNWSKARVAAEQLDQLDALLAANAGRRRAVGLKLSYRSLAAPDAYLQRLVSGAFVPVFMVRRNFLKCAVSQMRAQHRATGTPDPRWNSPWAVGRNEPKPGPITVDPDRVLRLLRDFERCHYALLAAKNAFPNPPLIIEYEDLAADPRAVIASMLNEIGLPTPENIRVVYRKATSDRLRDDIVNYDALASVVGKAGYGWFLDK